MDSWKSNVDNFFISKYPTRCFDWGECCCIGTPHNDFLTLRYKLIKSTKVVLLSWICIRMVVIKRSYQCNIGKKIKEVMVKFITFINKVCARWVEPTARAKV